MKQTSSALTFLLAQYRAIFKRAYIKGIASAVILTAGLAAGQAQAADPTSGLDGDNKYYFYNSTNQTWSEQNGNLANSNGIIAGALGGDAIKENTPGSLTPEMGKDTVTGGDLVINGVGSNDSLQYVQSGTVAGGWAQAKGNITASGNKVTITGSGYVDRTAGVSTPGSRGVVFGGYAVSTTNGIASASGNQIFVQQRDDAGLAKAAASHGLTGAKAIGVGGAVANNNEVHVEGNEDKPQLLSTAGEFDVLGAHVTTNDKVTSKTGSFTANQNFVDLKYVTATAGASDNSLKIVGARIAPSGTGTFTVSATGNKVSLNNFELKTASGSENVQVFGAWTADPLSSGTVTMSDNSITIADSKINKIADYTGSIRVVAASTQANKSTQVSLTGNNVTLSDSVNEQDKAADNKLQAEMVAGAIFYSAFNDASKKISATVTGNSVSVEEGVDLTIDDNHYLAGAGISVSGSKIAVLNANDNSVNIAGNVKGSVYATRFINQNNDTIAPTNTKLSFLNNDVTLKTGGKIQSGSIVGGAGKDSVITIDQGSTYIANNTNQDLASDVISISGTVQVDASNTLDISGFYKNGIAPTGAAKAEYHDNLTNIASSAVIKNEGTINLYGKAVVEQGATLTGTAANSKIVVDASKSLTAKDQILLPDDQKVAGADQGTLAIYKGTLQSYLKADKLGNAPTPTADNEGMVKLTSGGVLELRDTTNIDLATEFNFNTDEVAGAIVLDNQNLNLAGNSGSVIRGNDLTISRKLAENAVPTIDNGPAASGYNDLSGAETKGLQIEANTLTLGSSSLESWQSEEIKFGKAIFRDQLTFSAVNNGLSGSTGHESTINDGYHLVSEVVGDHYSALQEQGTSLTDKTIYTYYQAEDSVIEGDVTIKAGAAGAAGTPAADDGKLVIRNGNFKADDEITIASGGSILVGGDDGIYDADQPVHEIDGHTTPNAPDATLVLGQALTFDLSKTGAGTGTVNVSGATTDNQRYDADLAAETVGDDRYVMLDLSNGITLKADENGTIHGAAKISVTSGGEVLLTASNLNSLLAQNNAGSTKVASNSGAFFAAEHGGAFVVEGDVDATFGDFNATGNDHGITLNNKGYLVADSLTIDNSNLKDLNTSKEETAELLASGTVNWGDGTVVVQDLEISNLQLTHGNKPEGYASYVTLANGTAEISSSLQSYNQTLKLGVSGTAANLVFFTSDQDAKGTISVDKIQVDNGHVAAANGKWNGENTDLTLSGSGAYLAVGDGAGGYASGDDEEKYQASLTLNSITMSGENNHVSVNSDGSLFAHSLSMAASSTLNVAPYGYAEFDQVNFNALTTPADNASGAVTVYGHLKINGDTAATAHNGVDFGAERSIEIYKNGTLEFGLDAVNGAILNTSTTKTFSGSGSITLDTEYTKIANNGGTLKLDFAQGTVFDGEAIQKLKADLFTSGSLRDGVLVNGGILNIADGKFHGIEVSEQKGEGLSGYTATWESLKGFSDIYGNDVTNDQLLQTNVSGIKVSDEVKGHWASLSMDSDASPKAQVHLVGDTSLNFAAGNNGFFISDAAHQIALGAKVDGNRTLSLVDGGKISTVSLTAAAGNFEEETVLEVTSTGNNPSAVLTTIAEIKGENVDTNGVADGTVADFSADADVTGDITGIDYVEAYNGAKLTAQNTAFVHELGTENATIAIANKAQFGNAYVMGGTISAKNAEMLDTLSNSDEIAVVNGGWFKVEETLTAHSGATIQVGVDASSMPEDELTLEDGTVAGGTGYFEVGTLELRGGTLIVDPEYTEATSVAAVGKFKEGKQSYQYDNDKGILHGNLFVGQNAAFGLGATVEETQAAIAQFKVGNALDPEKYGSILYLNGQLDVSAGSHIALNSKESVNNKTTTAFLEATNAYNVSSETTEAGSSAVDRIAALGLGANTAIIMTNQAFEDANGEKNGTAIYFDRTNAAVKAGGGEIILAGDFDLSDNLNIFQDKDAEGKGVDIKDGKILVKTLNGFLYRTLEGDNQGYGVKLDVNKPEAYGIMSEASDPVVETLIAYGVGVTGGATTTPEAPETPVEPENPSTPEGEGNTGTGNGSIVDVVGGNTETPAPEKQVAMTEIKPQANAEEAPAQTAAKSSFLERVIVNTHGAPAEQAARLGVYGGAAQVGLAAAGSNSDVLESRFGIGANAQSLNLASNGMGGTLWVAPIYKSQDSDDFGAQGLNYGVDFDLYGVALGGDYKVTNEITVGAMFNVGSGSLDGQGNAAAAGTSNDFDYFGFALYGAYQAGALTVTGDLSYTQVDNDLEGSNEVGKLTASSDTSAWSLGVTGQYKFSFAAVDVTPHAGLRFTSLDLDDYSLEAAGYGNVANYDGDTLSVFSIPVGVTFAKTIEGESWNVTPALDLHVTGQFGDDEAEGTVAWSGTNLSTNVSSEIFDSFTYGATVGVQAESNSFSFGVGLGYTGSSNADEFSAQANARFTF